MKERHTLCVWVRKGKPVVKSETEVACTRGNLNNVINYNVAVFFQLDPCVLTHSRACLTEENTFNRQNSFFSMNLIETKDLLFPYVFCLASDDDDEGFSCVCVYFFNLINKKCIMIW